MATSEDLPDLIAYAATASEALENAKDVAQKLVDSYLEAWRCASSGFQTFPQHSQRTDNSGRQWVRLAGFTARQVIRKLRRAGFVFDRQAKGSHEIWRHPDTNRRAVVPVHPGDLPEGTCAEHYTTGGIDDCRILEALTVSAPLLLLSRAGGCQDMDMKCRGFGVERKNIAYSPNSVVIEVHHHRRARLAPNQSAVGESSVSNVIEGFV